MKIRDGTVVVTVSKSSFFSAANNAKNPTDRVQQFVCAGVLQAATVSA